MKHTFSFPGTPKSQNELDGQHWSKKHAERDYWHQVVGYTMPVCPFKPPKAHVHFVRVSKRMIDPLNVYAGLKWCLDAIVLRGWLSGDGYKDLTVSADQERGEPKLIVTIEYD